MAQQDAYLAAMNYLARREHTARELEVKLIAKGYLPSEIAEIILKLQKAGLQSDQRYVEMLVRTRQNQGYGPLRIRYELQQQGIHVSLLDSFLGDKNSWIELARLARNKKFGDDLPKEPRLKAKQMQFLQRRGFSSDQIREAFTPPEVKS